MTQRDRTVNGRFRILAVANETVEGGALQPLIIDHAAGRPADVLVVAPALCGRVRHWFSDVDEARAAAEDRLYATLDRLDAAGISAYGWVGDAGPPDAIAHAPAVFEADQLIVSTHPEKRSNWLAHDVVGRARQRFGLPVAHVVVDGDRTTLAAAA